VTCTRYETEEYDVSNPVLIVEVLSPSNRADTWRNVWAFPPANDLNRAVRHRLKLDLTEHLRHRQVSTALSGALSGWFLGWIV
jgi:hypothetical protein